MDLLEHYQDPTNLTKGILGRLQFKVHEKRALEPVYELHAQLQQALLNPTQDFEEIEDIAEELALHIRASEIQRQKWKWVEYMEREEQAKEYIDMKEKDELQKVTHEEIEQLLNRRDELEKKLANKIEFDKQMESVRTQPSRSESAQRIADLELDIEALQRRIKEQHVKHEDQQTHVRELFLPLLHFRDELKDNMQLRDELKKEYTDDHRSISPGSIPVTGAGEEEGEIHKKETPLSSSSTRHSSSGTVNVGGGGSGIFVKSSGYLGKQNSGL